MASVNNLQAVLSAKNVGISTTFINPKIIKGAILCPKGYKIPPAALATLQTQLLADASNSSKSQRIYPIGNLLEFKDNSEKAVEQSYGYGGKAIVRDGAYSWNFAFIKGGLSLQQQLRAFNGANWDFLFVDKDNNLIGSSYVDNAGLKGIIAIPSVQFYASPWGVNDGKKNAEYMLDFSFFPEYINEQVGFIADANFPIIDTIKGLIDLNLTGVGSGTPGTYTVVIKDNLGVNLYNQLAGLAGAGKINWSAINDTSLVALASITTVTLNPNADAGNGGFDVALPTGDAAYPTAGQKVRINLQPSGTLNTNSIVGFESAGYVAITKN